jgi:hypothetical protein
MRCVKSVLTLFGAVCFIISQAYPQAKTPPQKSIISTEIVVLRYKHNDSSYMQDHTDTLKIPTVSNQYPELKEALSFKKIVDEDGPDSLLKNYAGCGCGLTHMDYEVMFENKDIISLKIYSETMAAYPDSYTQWLTLNIHTGNAYPIDNEINPAGLKWIYDSYISLMKKRIASDKATGNADKELDDDAYNGIYKDLRTSIDTLGINEMLKSYVFTDRGVIFTTEQILPHVVHGLEPDREWFIPYKKLRPYKKANTLVLK